MRISFSFNKIHYFRIIIKYICYYKISELGLVSLVLPFPFLQSDSGDFWVHQFILKVHHGTYGYLHKKKKEDMNEIVHRTTIFYCFRKAKQEGLQKRSIAIGR